MWYSLQVELLSLQKYFVVGGDTKKLSKARDIQGAGEEAFAI